MQGCICGRMWDATSRFAHKWSWCWGAIRDGANHGRVGVVWVLQLCLFFQNFTFPETTIDPENRPSQKETIVFQPSIFRCYVSFRECNWSLKGLLSIRLGWSSGGCPRLLLPYGECLSQGWRSRPWRMKLGKTLAPSWGQVKMNLTRVNLQNDGFSKKNMSLSNPSHACRQDRYEKKTMYWAEICIKTTAQYLSYQSRQ